MRHTTRADAWTDDSAVAETYAGTVPAPNVVAVSATDAGTVSKPYDARALAGARRSHVAADDIAAVPAALAAADASADEKSHTRADALVHMRVHRFQSDGHMVRKRQLRPRVLGLLRHVLRRSDTSADAGAAASADASADASPLAETDIAADTSTLISTDIASDRSSVTFADTKPDAAPIHEPSDSGAIAAAFP